MMCAVALDRACELAQEGFLTGDVAHWRSVRKQIREFVETRCYSESKGSYTRSADEDRLDASLLLGVIARYDEPTSPRLIGTVDAVRRELADGPFSIATSARTASPAKRGPSSRARSGSWRRMPARAASTRPPR